MNNEILFKLTQSEMDTLKNCICKNKESIKKLVPGDEYTEKTIRFYPTAVTEFLPKNTKIYLRIKIVKNSADMLFTFTHLVLKVNNTTSINIILRSNQIDKQNNKLYDREPDQYIPYYIRFQTITKNPAFLDDKKKMYDFFRLSKKEFLQTYSYLTETEYEATRIQTNAMSHQEILERYGTPVNPVDVPELVGQFIDIFEDFLDEKHIVIPNEERDFNEDLDPSTSVNIYGTDYNKLAKLIRNTLKDWHCIPKGE